MKQAAVFLCLFVGVLLEQHLWDEMIMESPNELTVTDFELAEEGFSVVLTSAIEDGRELVEFLVKEHNALGLKWMQTNMKDDVAPVELDVIDERMGEVSEMKFRAMRVLGLLEAAREREAGRLV